MAVQPARTIDDNQIAMRNWTNPGLAVLGIGATAMVGGLTVLAIDVVRCHRDASRCGEVTALRSTRSMAARPTGRKGARP